MKVYLVQHQHKSKGGEDIKLIGVYSTEKLAAAAVDRIARQPGFCDSKPEFSIDEYQIDKDYCADGFVSEE